jgi:hypothetical protein
LLGKQRLAFIIIRWSFGGEGIWFKGESDTQVGTIDINEGREESKKIIYFNYNQNKYLLGKKAEGKFAAVVL